MERCARGQSERFLHTPLSETVSQTTLHAQELHTSQCVLEVHLA
jgi:hypothetical protein